MRKCRLNRNTRAKVLKRDGYRCFYCGKVLSKKSATMDHVEARAKGGSNGRKNLVSSCVECNRAKGSKSILEFAGEEACLKLRKRKKR